MNSGLSINGLPYDNSSELLQLAGVAATDFNNESVPSHPASNETTPPPAPQLTLDQIFGMPSHEPAPPLPYQKKVEDFDMLVYQVRQVLEKVTLRSQLAPATTSMHQVKQKYDELNRQLTQDKSAVAQAFNFMISQSFEHLVIAYAERKMQVE